MLEKIYKLKYVFFICFHARTFITEPQFYACVSMWQHFVFALSDNLRVPYPPALAHVRF